MERIFNWFAMCVDFTFHSATMLPPHVVDLAYRSGSKAHSGVGMRVGNVAMFLQHLQLEKIHFISIKLVREIYLYIDRSMHNLEHSEVCDYRTLTKYEK